MSDTDEIFDTGEPEIIEQKKKGRKPMSEERKQALREQLKKARDAKKAKKSGVEPPLPAPSSQPKVSKVKKMLEATDEEPAVYVKAVKRVGKDHSEDIKALKAEIASMRTSQGTDLDEVRALKTELKELRDIAKQYKHSQQSEKKKLVNNSVSNNKNNKPNKPNPYGEGSPTNQARPNEPVPVKNIYSAYKKSIWSQFT